MSFCSLRQGPVAFLLYPDAVVVPLRGLYSADRHLRNVRRNVYHQKTLLRNVDGFSRGLAVPHPTRYHVAFAVSTRKAYTDAMDHGQAVKWHHHRRSRELVTADTERTLHYFVCERERLRILMDLIESPLILVSELRGNPAHTAPSLSRVLISWQEFVSQCFAVLYTTALAGCLSPPSDFGTRLVCRWV